MRTNFSVTQPSQFVGGITAAIRLAKNAVVDLKTLNTETDNEEALAVLEHVIGLLVKARLALKGKET